MNARRWDEVKELLYAALLRQPNERTRFLQEACGADEALLEEVKALLVCYESGKSFFEKPLPEVGAAILAHQERTLVGKTLGHYRVLSSIGTGGMGEVYRAEDTRLGRSVALKLLPAQYTQDKNRLRRFKQEARAASSLNHPNILTIYEIGEVNESHFIATEFIEGETLRDRGQRSRLGLNETLDVAMQISSALDIAHRAGIIHRDIKPENIMIRHDGYVKVLDFGLAKLTERRNAESEGSTLVNTAVGVIMGTPPYMSPEQVRGLAVDARTDIWSLGVVIYEMIAGQPPFGRDAPVDSLVSILEKEPRPLADYVTGSPAELDRVVRKCLSKDRNDRYPSAQQLLTDLKNLQRDLNLGAAPAAAVTSKKRQFPLPTSRGWLAIPFITLLLLLVLLYLLVVRRASDIVRSDVSDVSSDITSLAVLPLENLSADPNQEYFADGMTEALIANLAKIKALRVISRTSVMQYKGVRKPLPEIARVLNVDGIIEGSVQRSGEQVRVTVQLIHGPTDRHLWTQTYVRELRDVLALQSEVAQAISGEIKVTLTPQEQSHLAKTRKVNPEAYDYYLRGKFYFNRYTEVDNKKAIELLEKAVPLDPTSAESHAALALAYQYQFNNFTPADRELQEKAFVESEKALSLEPELSDVYIARGRLLWIHANHFPHEEAIREYRRALSLNPNSDEALLQLGQVYGHLGMFDTAHQHLQRALDVNPANVRARWWIGQVLLYQGKYEESIATFRNLPRELNPHMTGYHLAWALFQLGRKDQASATLAQFLRDFPEDTAGTLNSMQAVIFAAAGERAQAEQKIKVAAGKDRDSIQFHHTAYNIGVAYVLMNKTEDAVTWLRDSAEDGFPCYPVFEKDPNLNNIRSDGRFIEFMNKLKTQWEHYRSSL